MTLLIEDAMTIMASKEFYDAYKIVPFIAFAYVLNGSCYILRMGFYLRGKTEYAGIIMVLTTIFTLTMYYILIPPMGALGAAIATVLSFFFWNSLTYIVCQRVYKIHYEWGRIIRIVGCSFLLITIANLIQLKPIPDMAEFFVKCVLILAFPSILWFAKFFTTKEREEMNKSKIWITGKLLLLRTKTSSK